MNDDDHDREREPRDDERGEDRHADVRDHRRDASRRELLGAAIGVGLGLGGVSMLAAIEGLRPRIAQSPTTEPPKPGDLLTFAEGGRRGNVITPDDLAPGGPQVLAWPMDPELEVIKSARHDNLILLVKAGNPDWLASTIRPHASGTIVAYSAICTHLCCTVSDWRPKAEGSDPHGYLLCPCHMSYFDPWDGGKVLAGPAPRPLPELPITISNGRLAVASEFLAPLGCQQG